MKLANADLEGYDLLQERETECKCTSWVLMCAYTAVAPGFSWSLKNHFFVSKSNLFTVVFILTALLPCQ